MKTSRLPPFLVIPLLCIPASAQPTAPRISLAHAAGSTVIHLPWAQETNTWCMQASTQLGNWTGLGELMEVRGQGRFPDPDAHLYNQRFYRVIHKGSDLLAALDRNRARWESNGSSNYDFTFRWSCFCIPDFVERVRITVRNDTITSVTRLRDGTPIDESQFGFWHTIDGLFDYLEPKLDPKPHAMSIRFDAQFGAPQDGWIDPYEFFADDGIGFALEDIRLIDPNTD